jgi:translation initiation factor 2B subunit (eIF-2B alpha/beta/delta family)
MWQKERKSISILGRFRTFAPRGRSCTQRVAEEHSEVILTMGYSKTVEHFLKQAAKDRNFQVIVAETSTLYVFPRQ